MLPLILTITLMSQSPFGSVPTKPPAAAPAASLDVAAVSNLQSQLQAQADVLGRINDRLARLEQAPPPAPAPALDLSSLTQSQEQTRGALAQMQSAVSDLTKAVVRMSDMRAAFSIPPPPNPQAPAPAPAKAAEPVKPKGRFAGYVPELDKWFYHDDPEEVRYAIRYHTAHAHGMTIRQYEAATAPPIVTTASYVAPVVSNPVVSYAAPVTYAAPVATYAPTYAAPMVSGGLFAGGGSFSSGLLGGLSFGLGGGCQGGSCR